MKEKITIIYTSSDRDADKLYVSLKTLEFFQPNYDFDVYVISEEPKPQKIENIILNSENVNYFEWPDKIGYAIDTLINKNQSQFNLILHSDIVFLDPSWFDSIFSLMLDKDIHVFGSNQFINAQLNENQNQKMLPAFFIALTKQGFDNIGGFGHYGEGENRGVFITLKAIKKNIRFAGGDIEKFVKHLNICEYDKKEINKIINQKDLNF